MSPPFSGFKEYAKQKTNQKQSELFDLLFNHEAGHMFLRTTTINGLDNVIILIVGFCILLRVYPPIR
jgi:hypothetical protein